MSIEELKRCLISVSAIWAAFGAIVVAPSARAQLDLNAERLDAVAFAKDVSALRSAAQLTLTFDFRMDSRSEFGAAAGMVVPPSVVVGSDEGSWISLTLPNFSEGLIESVYPTPAWRPRFLLEESPPIPEPSTYGWLGAVGLLLLIAVQRIRDKSTSLAL